MNPSIDKDGTSLHDGFVPSASPDDVPVPSSEVGFEGQTPTKEINTHYSESRPEPSAASFLSGMEALLTRLLSANPAPPTSSPYMSTQLIKFDPEDADADIEGWCKLTEIIVNSRKLEGPELLLALTYSLKGSASTCLTKLNISEIKWPPIKELLLAKFSKSKLMQDYFDEVIKFQISAKETALEAAVRLWTLIERIPNLEMAENVITGFAIPVLSQRDALIRRELNSHIISTKAQLCRVLGGISLKRKHEDIEKRDTEPESKRFRTETQFLGLCHFCGIRGHKIEECRKRRASFSANQMTKITEREKTVTCFSCGKVGHLSTTCPEKPPAGPRVRKEVQLCECRLPRGTLSTSTGEAIPFLFDSGSACSLIKSSFVHKLTGKAYNDLVYLTGIGGNDVECRSQILSVVKIQDFDLAILFHVVPDDVISDEIIIGRDILAHDVHVEIESNLIRFSKRKEVNSCSANIKIDLSSIDTDLQGADREALLKVLTKYSKYFIDGVPTRRVTTGQLKIDLIDPHKVVQRHPYRLSPTEKEVVKDKVQSLLDAGVIRESSSPFASPILLVKKKDGTDRLCVDYRELNANTHPEHYPLPRIHEQIDRLNGAHYFSSLDMASGYHQIAVDQDSIEKTAFVTPDGQYEYLAMPFGLRNAASVYQRCMNKALMSLKDTVVSAYMDDVLCFSSDVAEGLRRLDAVLATLSEAGFSFNIRKCKFVKTEVHYLGYVIRAGEVRPNPHKIKALIDAPTPSTATQVR